MQKKGWLFEKINLENTPGFHKYILDSALANVLMFETTRSSKDHRDGIFITGFNNFFVAN